MTEQFAEIFAKLKAMMKKHERTLKVLKDEPQEYTLVSKSNTNRGQPMWFGSVRAGKAYVSYHLMALYYNPTLNATVSPALKKRMQGKTCFNFKTVDPDLFAELTALTKLPQAGAPVKYVAFLRAINVGGHVVKMEELRRIFSALKFSNVETMINSGNLIFDTKAAPDRKLEETIEKRLEAELGYEVGTFVRSVEEIRAIGEYQPFQKEGLVLSIGFGRGIVKPAALEEFKTEVDDFHVHGREVYWLCQIRTSDSKFPAKKFEKLTGPMTWRNRNTVVKLSAKYSH